MSISGNPAAYWHCCKPFDIEQLGCTLVPSWKIDRAIRRRGQRTFTAIHGTAPSRPWRCAFDCDHPERQLTALAADPESDLPVEFARPEDAQAHAPDRYPEPLRINLPTPCFGRPNRVDHLVRPAFADRWTNNPAPPREARPLPGTIRSTPASCSSLTTPDRPTRATPDEATRHANDAGAIATARQRSEPEPLPQPPPDRALPSAAPPRAPSIPARSIHGRSSRHATPVRAVGYASNPPLNASADRSHSPYGRLKCQQRFSTTRHPTTC